MSRYDAQAGARIPLARQELLKIARQLRQLDRLPETAKLIEDIVRELLHRHRPAKPVARTTARRVTTEVIREMAYWYGQNPTMSTDHIGGLCGVNGGRVSEWLQGQRTETYPGGTPQWKAHLKAGRK